MFWGLGFGLLVALVLGVVGYAASHMGRLPAGNPAAVLADGGPPTDRPVLVCLGDSITQGGLGADWVDGVRQHLSDTAFVVNAGVGGQITWDLRQRLDAVARCRPSAIVLMTGSNDAVGALGGRWASFYERGRPRAPSQPWFAEEYRALVDELRAITPRVLCLTLPPLGEDPTTKAAAMVRGHNALIRECAAQRGVDLIDVNAALLEIAEQDTNATQVPFLSGVPQFMAWALGSNLRHRIFGQAWNAIGHSRGLAISTDTIHPNERAASLLVNRVAGWAQRTLSLTTAPRTAAHQREQDTHG